MKDFFFSELVDSIGCLQSRHRIYFTFISGALDPQVSFIHSLDIRKISVEHPFTSVASKSHRPPPLTSHPRRQRSHHLLFSWRSNFELISPCARLRTPFPDLLQGFPFSPILSLPSRLTPPPKPVLSSYFSLLTWEAFPLTIDRIDCPPHYRSFLVDFQLSESFLTL